MYFFGIIRLARGAGEHPPKFLAYLVIL